VLAHYLLEDLGRESFFKIKTHKAIAIAAKRPKVVAELNISSQFIVYLSAWQIAMRVTNIEYQ
jgi:hypothetical protein